MKSQIFKNIIPIEILYDLLKHVISDDDSNEYYIINKIIYKKLNYNDDLNKFLNDIKDYYYISKQFYVTRDMNYTRFLTIIRQICKINNVMIEHKINFIKNSYEIIYYINKNNT